MNKKKNMNYCGAMMRCFSWSLTKTITHCGRFFSLCDNYATYIILFSIILPQYCVFVYRLDTGNRNQFRAKRFQFVFFFQSKRMRNIVKRGSSSNFDN